MQNIYTHKNHTHKPTNKKHAHQHEKSFLLTHPKYCSNINTRSVDSWNAWNPYQYYICEPQHNKTNKMTRAPSEDSDQPGHLSSLISLLFTVCMKKSWVLKTPIGLGECPAWSESLLGAHVILLLLLCSGSCYQFGMRQVHVVWFSTSH